MVTIPWSLDAGIEHTQLARFEDSERGIEIARPGESKQHQ